MLIENPAQQTVLMLTTSMLCGQAKSMVFEFVKAGVDELGSLGPACGGVPRWLPCYTWNERIYLILTEHKARLKPAQASPGIIVPYSRIHWSYHERGFSTWWHSLEVTASSQPNLALFTVHRSRIHGPAVGDIKLRRSWESVLTYLSNASVISLCPDPSDQHHG